jgi:hypothetical protein
VTGHAMPGLVPERGRRARRAGRRGGFWVRRAAMRLLTRDEQ